MTDIPVRPEMVRWAREHRGLTLEAAADKLSVPVNILASVERGEQPVYIGLFKKLSARLKIPGPTLLRQTAPTVPPAPIDFRTLNGLNPSLGFETRIAISYAYTIEQNILELIEAEAIPETPHLPLLRLRQSPERAGEEERRRLGISNLKQLAWRQKEAFRNWRTVIEAAGIYVILKKFPIKDCRGFTIYRRENAPIIVINKAELFEPARTFTLIHEYAHILLRKPGMSDLDERNPVEAFCNKFASSFLMPHALIQDILPYWPDAPEEWSIHDLRDWARQLKVSQQALALRLEGLGIAPVGYYGRIVQQQIPVPKREGTGGDYVNTQVNELGDKFTKNVISAEQVRNIPSVEASDILDIAPRHFARITEQIERQKQRVGVA